MSDDPPMEVYPIRLPPDLVARIDRYRHRIPMRPGRSQVIRFLLEHAITILEGTDNDGTHGA